MTEETTSSQNHPPKNGLSALLIGQRDDRHSSMAETALKDLGYAVETFLTGQDRAEKLPGRVLDWSGDLIFHIRSYHILPEPLLARARVAAINFHPAPPHYRGAGGYNWALYNNDALYGVTAHIMDTEIDNGPILHVYPLKIRPEETLGTLIERAHALQAVALAEIAARIAKTPETAVRDMIDTYAGADWSGQVRRIAEIDALQAIPLNATADEVARIIRATRIGRFRPYIDLQGYRFVLEDTP